MPPRPIESWLWLVQISLDVGLHLAGGVILVAFVYGLVRRGVWRDPLGDVGLSPSGPRPITLAIVLLTYLSGVVVLSTALTAGRARLGVGDVPIDSGSAWWHALIAVEHFAKVCAAVLAVLLLLGGSGTERPAGRRVALLLSIPVVLVLLALTTLQYRMVVAIWQWIDPSVALPDHVVLEALGRDPLPPWGAMHLTFQATLVAGFCEEVFFRGLVLGVFAYAARSVWLGIVVSSAAFGLMHIHVPQTVLPLITMGLVLGYVRVRTGSIAICVAAHVLFNLRTMVLSMVESAALQS